MCTYLSTRQSTYYFRRVVPAELRPFLGNRREWMISLGTKDREAAKRLIPKHTIATDAEIDRARAAMADAAPNGPQKPAERRSPRVEAWEDAMFQHSLEGAEIAYREMVEKEERYAERAPLRRRLERAFRKSTAEITPEEAAARDLLRDAQAEIDSLKAGQLAASVLRAEQRRGLVLSSRLPPAPVDTKGGAMLDTDVIDSWAAERKVTAKGKDTHAGVVRWFYERCGRKPVDQITRKDVLAFKDSLIADNTAANTNMKLSRLQTLLQWAEDNDYREGNPAKGVRVLNTDAAKNKRKPFDIGSLNAIFSSPVYSENARPTQGKGEAAYWLPLLALFTGARLEELGQIRPMDVQLERYPDDTGEERSAWFIHIREDDDDNLKLKNAASERVIPVHPELEQLGFIRFVEAANKAGQARVFALLKPDIYGRLTAKWGEWFGPYLRKTVGIADKRLVFHSFRHTFKDYARHAGVVEGVQRQIMGHSAGDVADEYGSGYSLHQLVEGMKLYKVPGLKMPQ